MNITLTPYQESAIQNAMQAGLIHSTSEFIDSAIGALLNRETGFDKEKARLAVARIREIRKGVKLDLEGMSIRTLAHIGHKH